MWTVLAPASLGLATASRSGRLVCFVQARRARLPAPLRLPEPLPVGDHGRQRKQASRGRARRVALRRGGAAHQSRERGAVSRRPMRLVVVHVADGRFSGHSLRPAPVWPRSPGRRTRDTSASADRSRRQVCACLLRHDVRGVQVGRVLVSHSLCQPFLSRCPVRFSCSAWAPSARRSALARSGVDANAVPPVSIRPGAAS